jgi:hypothetical protein
MTLHGVSMRQPLMRSSATTGVILAPNDACGFLPIAGLLIEAARRGLRAQRLSLCNSGDTAGGRDRVVGYGAWIFEEKRDAAPAGENSGSSKVSE